MKKTIIEPIIFIKDVDCKKIVGERESYRPSFESNLPTTLKTNFRLRQDSLQYLTDIIMECMGELKDPIESIAYEVIWRNKYAKRSDFRDTILIHILTGVLLFMKLLRNLELNLYIRLCQ